MTAPTALQLEVLILIAKSIRERGYPPSIREIGPAIGRRFETARLRLLSLRAKGLVTFSGHKSRGVAVTPEGWAALGEEPTRIPFQRATHTLVELRPCLSCGALTFSAHPPRLCRVLQAAAPKAGAS